MSAGTVLVVDDDPGIVELLAMALECEGYSVIAALGREALVMAETLHVDVILLDVMMPGMDGIEMSRRLRLNPMTAPIPIVAMSALHNLDQTASSVLADDRIAKPFHLKDLYEIVRRCCATPSASLAKGTGAA